MLKFVSVLVMMLVLPLRGEIFADLKIRHRPASASEDLVTTVRIRLEHEKVPRIVAHFIGLATGERAWIDPVSGRIQEGVPYYDGLVFHRLIHNFVIQGGDPLGTGSGGPGYVVQDEFDQSLRHSGRYFVSCAKTSNPNTFGSQFFITLEATPHLDDKHSIFGEVVNMSVDDSSSRDFIDGLTSATEYPTGAGNRPATPITLESVSFSGADFAGFDVNDPLHRLPYVEGMVSEIQYGVVEEVARMTSLIDRKPNYNYRTFFSTDLESWSFFRNVLSVDAEDDFEFLITGVPEKFFYREVAVNYSQVYNPKPEIFVSGASLKFQSADGYFITLISDGLGGGTWLDEAGASGGLSRFEVSDYAPDTGVFISSQDQSEFIPLMNLIVDFDGAAGVAGYTALRGKLSFHSETTGGFEGTDGLLVTSPFNRPFIFTPGP